MRTWKNLTVVELALGLTLGGGTFASAAQADSDGVVCVQVSVRGSDVNSCLEVFENPNDLGWEGKTIVAVHGYTRTALSWEGFADALYSDDTFKWTVGRVLAIDLPGRGESPAVPLVNGLGGYGNTAYGTLRIEDNVSIIIQTLEGLPAQGYNPSVLMGHSMGGLEVQGVQEALLAQGSRLADLGVDRAVLLAPVPHAGAQWALGGPTTDPACAGVPGLTVVPTVAFGVYLIYSPATSLCGGAFTRQDGTLADSVPSEWLELDPGSGLPTGIPQAWIGWEPLSLAQQLGSPNRPKVRDGAFAAKNGTKLTLISFEQDMLTPTIYHPALYEQLVGRRGPNFHVVTGTGAVHEIVTVDPDLAVQGLRMVPGPF